MKKKFLFGTLGLFCLLSIQTLSFAQEENYLEEGKEWTTRVSASWCSTELVAGEVERNGHLWKHVLVDGREFLLYRQDGKKIWACYPYEYIGMDTVPFLMFDFGLEKGDTAHLYVDTVHHIDDVWIVEDVFDSVFEPGQAARHCQSVYLMKYPDRKDLWVEGLGSLEHGLSYIPSQNLRGPLELICVLKSTGDVVYHNKKYPSCYVPYTQTRPNVVQEGRQWSHYKGLSQGGFLRFTGENLVMFFGSDTLIDGKTYKNVLYRQVFYWDNFDELPSYDWGCALREEGSKVYHYDYKTQKERLMFDFSLKQGDTIETYSKFEVTSVGVLEGEDSLRYIELKSTELGGCDDRWIEKIGSQTSGIFWNDCWCCVGYWSNLACCKERDAEEPFFFGEFFSECLSAEYAAFTGKIAFVSNPPSNQQYLSNADTSMVWAVIDNPKEQEYDALKRMTLMRNSTPFAQRLVVDGVEYVAGDEVEISGWRSSDMTAGGGGTDSYLEIFEIKRNGTPNEPSQEFELLLTPNPANETITLSAAGCKLQRVEILDVNGRILYASALNDTDSFRYNVSWLPSGIYLARVTTPCGVLTEKFSVR